MQRHKIHFAEQVARVGGFVSSSIGILALLGWVFHYPLLTNFGSNFIPIAPSTALLFLFMGIVNYVYAHSPQNKKAFLAGIILSSLCVLISLTLLLLWFAGIKSGLEHLGISITQSSDVLVIGHMSPLTATGFIFTGLAYLVTFFSSQKLHQVILSFIMSCLVFSFSSVLFLGYVFNIPAFYGGSIIPPALPTSLAFILLGAALTISNGLKIWERGRLHDEEATRELYILFSIFLVIGIGLITTGYLYFQKFNTESKANAQEQLSSIADLKMFQLIQYRNERMGDALLLHKNYAFSNLVKRYLEKPDDLEAFEQLRSWFTKYLDAFDYDNITMIDLQGKSLLSVPGSPIPLPSVISRRIPELLRTREIIFEDFFRSEKNGKIYLALLLPVLEKNRVIAIIAFYIDPELFLYPYISRWPTISKSAETLLLRQENNDAVFLNELRFEKNAALTMHIPLTSKNIPGAGAVLGKKGVMEGTDYRGAFVLAYVGTIPNSPWFLVSKMDIAEIYAPIAERFWQMVVFISLLLVILGIAVIYVWRHQRSRLLLEKYKTAEALHRAEAGYRRLFETAKDGILILDAKTGSILDVNPYMINLLGYPFDAFIGKPFWEFGFPEDVVANRYNFTELQQNKYIRYDNLPLKASDGSKIDVEFVSNVYEVDNRKVAQCNIRNISERKRMEEELREANTNLENLINSANAPIIVWDPQFHILRFNHAFEFLTGRSEAEVLGQSLEILFPDSMVEESMQYIRDASTGKSLDAIEIKIIHKNNSPRTVLWNSATLFAQDGKTPLATIAQGYDITKRKLADTIHLARMRLIEISAASSLMPLMRMTVDEICALSDSPIGFFHFVEEDERTLQLQAWSTKTTEEMCTAEGSGKHYDIDKAGVWVDCIRQRKPVIHNEYATLPHRKGLPAGHAPIIREMLLPITRFDKIVAVVGIGNKTSNYTDDDVAYAMQLADLSWDIIKRKRAEDEILVQNDKLSTLNAEKDKFFSVIAHDLRSPVSGLLGLTEIMATESSDFSADEIKRLSTELRNSVSNIYTLLGNLLEWAQFQRDSIVFSPKELDFSKIFSQCEDSVRQRALQKEISITLESPPGLKIFADERMISSVLRNLLSNAVKFTRKNGQITVTSKQNENGMSVISVIDTGIGIPQNIIGKLFKLGEKTGSRGTDNEPSTGLGLILCKEFVEKHGGAIRAESIAENIELGQTGGSTFTVTIPLP